MKNKAVLFRLLILSAGLAGVFFTSQSLFALQHPPAHTNHSPAEAHGKKWMISTQGSATTQIASEVMKRGGTLVDAAVAASFAISVERPHSTGLGGGGFLIYHEAKTGKNYVFDFRERAPFLASHNMYLDDRGNVIPELSVTGSVAVGTPGMVRGLAAFYHQFGTLAWSSLITPSAKLAKAGIKVYEDLANALSD